MKPKTKKVRFDGEAVLIKRSGIQTLGICIRFAAKLENGNEYTVDVIRTRFTEQIAVGKIGKSWKMRPRITKKYTAIVRSGKEVLYRTNVHDTLIALFSELKYPISTINFVRTTN